MIPCPLMTTIEEYRQWLNYCSYDSAYGQAYEQAHEQTPNCSTIQEAKAIIAKMLEHEQNKEIKAIYQIMLEREHLSVNETAKRFKCSIKEVLF